LSRPSLNGGHPSSRNSNCGWASNSILNTRRSSLKRMTRPRASRVRRRGITA